MWTAIGVAAGLMPAAAAAFDFTLGVGPVAACQSPAAGLRAAALTVLEPTPVLRIREYGRRRYDPEPGENLAVGVGYADLAAPVGHTCLAAFYRTDYVGQATRDALDALVANRNDRPFDVGRTYELGLDSTWLQSAGFKVSRVFGYEPWSEWSVRVGVSASLMKALSLRRDTLIGRAMATSGDYAVGTATLRRADSDYDRKDFNPFVGRADPDGYGFGADVGLVVRSPAGWVTELTVMDAYTRFDWRDVPQSMDKADNQTIRYDANFNREAFVQGVDRRVDVTQPLDPRYRAAQSVPVGRGLTVIVSNDYAYDTHFPAVGLQYQWEDIVTRTTYDTRMQAVSLDCRWSWLAVSITADDPDFGDASVLGASLQFVRDW
jgi:hypothetical protein